MRPLGEDGLYILIGQTPVPEPDRLKWVEWYETAERVAFQDEVEGTATFVSTVFLGLDHRRFGPGPPLLFETMTWVDGEPRDMLRCSTWLEAEAQHKRMVEEATRMRDNMRNARK